MTGTLLTGREKALLSRGYPEEDILRFSRVPRSLIEETAGLIYERLTKNAAAALPGETPECIFIGAQPGGGKSTRIHDIQTEPGGKHLVALAMDNYRSFHPRYEELEKLIAAHWVGRPETDNDSPGSDMADFTQLFSGDVVDILEARVSGENGGPCYNILYEWAMRAPGEPLAAMRRLKQRGYRITVDFIAVNAKVSLEACRQRSRLMNSKGRVLRTIPDNFHELSVERLPTAIDTIYRTGYLEERTVDRFVVTNRAGKVLWEPGNEGMPGEIFAEILRNGPLTEPNETIYSEEAFWRETKGFPEIERL